MRNGSVDRKQLVEVLIDVYTVSLSVDFVQDSPTGIVITKVSYVPLTKAHLDGE